MTPPLHLRLPATSANLGPGFDALGLAMSLYLTIEASESTKDSIEAAGRDVHRISNPHRNLILNTYRDVLAAHHRPAPSLHLNLYNEIPLGMGCGSSAAALLAGVHLANHFGHLGWTSHQVMVEACLREGHPDNVAACALGGMTTSCQEGSEILAATCGHDLPWKLLLAIPSASLATEKARALLPPTYSRADAVANIQRSSLLVAAFALNRPDLLRTAMQDRIHQPYRSEACPLLPLLLPLAMHPGVYGVALSGAGPSVLLLLDPSALAPPLPPNLDPELVTATISGGAQVTGYLGGEKVT
jgi:homoserine kinase